MITTKQSIADDIERYSAGFKEAAADDAPADAAEPSMAGEKLAGLTDWLKPAGDGVSSQTHAAMREAGVGPYDGSNAKPAPAIQKSDSGVDNQIMDAKARDRKNREGQMMETIRKVYPQKEWDRALKEKMKAEGW